MSPYIEMTKPRIAVMVLVTTVFAYVFAEPEVFSWTILLFTLLGTGMAGGGASVLNMYLERDIDALMDRTKNRPIPSGKVSAHTALYYGVFLAIGGCLLLLWQVNMTTAFLALMSTFLYVLVYTPMKRLTWLNTTVGAVPGAMPPLIGWAASDGTLGAGAWILFAILFIWQHPHFFAIAWIFRDDYERGGLKMLPVVHPDGRNMFAQVLLFSLALIPVSMLPYFLGISGLVYLVGVVLIGLGMLASALLFMKRRTPESARIEVRTSIVYLPLLLLLIIVDSAIF